MKFLVINVAAFRKTKRRRKKFFFHGIILQHEKTFFSRPSKQQQRPRFSKLKIVYLVLMMTMNMLMWSRICLFVRMFCLFTRTC